MAFIEFKNVTYVYNAGQNDEVLAVNDVSFDIEKGDFVAIVGHNGSGKSTIAKLINGLFEPDRGKVFINGMDTADESLLFDIRKTAGVVFQNPDNQMVASIIEDDIAFGPENLGLKAAEIRERVDWALKSVGMYEHRAGTPYRLSGGQKQRVAIAGVLAIKPEIMILDESTSMLDPKGREEVLDIVKRLNRDEKMTVIMITHFMEEALLADRIIVLNKGKIMLDGGKEVLQKADELKTAGLLAPFAVRIKHELIKRGVVLDDDIMDIEKLAEGLCQ